MDEPLIETWAIHNRITLYFLAAIPDEVFVLPSTPIHRLVFQLFAHIHNIRLMWPKTAAPNLLEGLARLEGKEGHRADLGTSLTASGKAIEELLRQGLAAGGKIRRPAGGPRRRRGERGSRGLGRGQKGREGLA